MFRTRQSAVNSKVKKKRNDEMMDLEEIVSSFDQKVKDLEFEKKEFIKKLDLKESKILKKKEKIQNLRILINELKEKLTNYNDRELQNNNLLKMKEEHL